MFFKKALSFSNLTLLVALSLSTVAAYYSIIGLTAIFAGAVIPIIIMGSILEVGKITTTVWLRKYWHRASLTLKFYLVPAVILLAFLTSMGIFGFLSKAHSDQSLVSGDVLAKLEIIDEKIKISKENIDANRKALKQLDEAVDQVMGRSTSEAGADKAVAIRKAQTRDRTRLLAEIAQEQKTITKLNEEAAPIRAEVRKVEAEVGPIKYIAAFIYGDNPDNNLLESAVRWVIILIVIVFDPLAIALVLAANASKEWDKEEINEDTPDPYVADVGEKPTQEELEEIEKETKDPHPAGWMFKDPGEHPKDFDDKFEEEEVTELSLPEPDPIKKPEPEKPLLEQHPYLNKGFVHFGNLPPLVYNSEPEKKEITVDSDEPLIENPTTTENKILAAGIDVIDRPGDYVTEPKEIKTEGVTKEHPLKDLNDGYVLYDGARYSKQALKEIKPELFIVKPDSESHIKTNFGVEFPKIANKGDIFIRVDILPNRVYKFDSKRWIEINKTTTDSYLYDQEYIKYLVSKISTGEYDLDILTENERTQIEDYLNNQKS